MVRIDLFTLIVAPASKCFDLARDIDLHVKSMEKSGEKAVAGTVRGLIGPGESVTWRARHFGIEQEFTSMITGFNPPHYFQDKMVKGAFRYFIHDHYFEAHPCGTMMRDVVHFQAPFGLVGRMVEILFLHSYLTKLISQRANAIKETAEAPSASASTSIQRQKDQ